LVVAATATDERFGSGARRRVSLPARTADALYAAFRIRGKPGIEAQKDGLRIAMTALTPTAP
jgi:hypothetical protein